MFQELNFSEIKAAGWAKRFLNTQATGLTGEMGKVGKPFSDPTWEASDSEASNLPQFLGGLNSVNDAWVPFEQNGYWIDGAIRAGHLADNEKLLVLGRSKIYPAIENAQPNGFIGPAFLDGGLTWPHTVYFRALTAEYTATGNRAILEAMERHFRRRPIIDAYAHKDRRIIAVRQAAEIESVLWLYGQTGKQEYLQMARDSYEVFNRIYSDDTEADVNSEMRDISLPGMLGNRKVQRNHGVTYCEICKLAAVLHLYTGEDIYKTAAVKAFDKVYRDQMLIDGVFSSTEYLNGNEDSWAMHETCVVSDMTWALGYLYMITGDTKYGDWIENAIFNAGLASVDDDFKGNQYFSCPNQVITNDRSNHGRFFRGKDWISYAPKAFLACCAGNVNRFMPNFVYHSWMRDGDTLSAVTYCPSTVTTVLDGHRVTVKEETCYPFENTVRFHIETDAPAAFTLLLRCPNWAVEASLAVNAEAVPFSGNTCSVQRVFRSGDTVELVFTDRIELIENARGISVKKGPLLYALPVEEKQVIEGLRELNNPDFPHYSLYPESQWNFAVSAKDAFTFIPGDIGEEPWRRKQNGLTICATGYEVKNWKLQYVKRVQSRILPRVACRWEDQEAVFTPKVRPLTAADPVGAPQPITLVPYCTTRLRIAIFPRLFLE